MPFINHQTDQSTIQEAGSVESVAVVQGVAVNQSVAAASNAVKGFFICDQPDLVATSEWQVKRLNPGYFYINVLAEKNSNCTEKVGAGGIKEFDSSMTIFRSNFSCFAPYCRLRPLFFALKVITGHRNSNMKIRKFIHKKKLKKKVYIHLI